MMPGPHPPPARNRLAGESSPYLLQHADNPVAWYPWGAAAWGKAREQQKPIFLSIGYSTCHWCHVMERESFSDPAIAALLNAHFIAIKVDREERPDVDHLYMQAVMQLTGQGGWPLSLFLTPDLKPFYGGTYFPPEDRWGRPGFPTVLKGIAEAWAHRREELTQAGAQLTLTLQAEAATAAPGRAPVTAQGLRAAAASLAQAYDAQAGGFAPAPKFPRCHALSLLLRVWRRTGDAALLRMVEHTLQAMAAGGVYDQLGGGFHRYSTDAQWRVPHFEKMLYDQALAATTYLEAFQATGQAAYAATARQIIEYVLRDLTDPAGGFYSAEDADSARDPARPHDKAEGAYYVWTAEEVTRVVGAAGAPILAFLDGIEPSGNTPDDPTGQLRGQNVLSQAHTVAEAAARFQRPAAEIAEVAARARAALLAARAQRPRPHLDDKVLTDWNGLMIAGLAFGARVLDEPRYRERARRAADFVLARLVRGDGRLLHRARAGVAGIPGTLDDYAFFIHGLVELYQATGEPRYLAAAQRLAREMGRLFWDEGRGGMFMTAPDGEPLLVRSKAWYDGAIPAGNSVAALDLLRVGRLTMDGAMEHQGRALIEGFSAELSRQPTAYPQMLIAVDCALGPSAEVVVAGPPDAAETAALLRAVAGVFAPHAVVALHPTGASGQAIEALVPFVKGQGTVGGRPAAYVCRNSVCEAPTTDPARVAALLRQPD